MVFRIVCSLICLILVATVQADVVKGRVVGADGRPIVGAEISPYWEINNDIVAAWEGTTTRDDGSFELDIELASFRQMLYVMNAERTIGGYVMVGPASGVPDVEIDVGVIKLEPLVELRGDYYCDDLKARPSYSIVNVAVILDGQEMMVGYYRSTRGKFMIKLPPGEYHLFHGFGNDFKNVWEFKTLPVGKAVVDRGTVKIEQSVLAKYYGKKPPNLTVTDARGIDKNISLKDFRGKWTLVEYWGFW